MKAVRNFICVGLLVAMSAYSYAQEIWTIGPMFHFGLNGEKKDRSFSIEASYWNFYHFFYSVDLGVEFDHGRTRIYSEAQTGIGFTGVSLGPVAEFSKGGNTRLGVQGSCWVNYIVGFDYRIRFIGGEKLQYTGIYAKLPFAASGLDDDGDGSDWDDWDDWD